MKKSYILAQYRLHADHDTPHIAHPSGTAAAVWSPGAVMSPPHDIFTTRCTILPSVLHNHSYIHLKAPFKVHKSTNHWCILNSVFPDKVENTFAPAPDLSLTWRIVRTNCSGDVSATTAPGCLETRHTWRRNNWSIMKTKCSSHLISLDLTEVLLKVSEDTCVWCRDVYQERSR